MATGPSSPPAYEAVADHLRDQIVDGTHVAGTRLPSEADLALQFGVSRSTVREALRTLASAHLVTTQRGLHGGTFVAVPEIDDLAAGLTQGMAMLVHAGQVSAEHILDVQRLTQVHAAGLAAARRMPRDLEALSPWLVAGRLPEGDAAADRAFHLAVVTAAANPLLDVQSRALMRVLDGMLGQVDVCASAEHVAVADAIASADPARAEAAMAIHLDAVREDTLRALANRIST